MADQGAQRSLADQLAEAKRRALESNQELERQKLQHKAAAAALEAEASSLRSALQVAQTEAVSESEHRG